MEKNYSASEMIEEVRKAFEEQGYFLEHITVSKGRRRFTYEDYKNFVYCNTPEEIRGKVIEAVR